jgi:serine/threonine-protein kinase
MNHSYPQPGTILAERYRVGEVIGRGGMGVVLAAENTVTQRRVAIKWLRSDLVDNAEAAERLVREASVASRIRHPNVVDVFDVLRDGSSIFLVMDLLQGESLEAVLHRGGIPLHELVSILLPAMRGVAEAHRHSIATSIRETSSFRARATIHGRFPWCSTSGSPSSAT